MLHENKIPIWYIANKIKVDMIFVLVFMGAYSSLNYFFDLGELDIPIAVPTILGTSISLIIGFRINQSYMRWWEARMVWGEIVNESRNVLRQLIGFLPADEKIKTQLYTFARRQVFFCFALGRSLRGQSLDDLKDYLIPKEAETIFAQTNKANAAMLQHSRQISQWAKEGKLNTYQQVEADNTVKRLVDAMGKCERIKSTVFPTTFSLMVLVLVYLFIFFLPFGLNSAIGLYKIPIVLVFAIVFLLLEKTAKHLQDPFSHLPQDTAMTNISVKIERNLYDMLDKPRHELYPDDGIRSFFTI